MSGEGLSLVALAVLDAERAETLEAAVYLGLDHAGVSLAAAIDLHDLNERAVARVGEAGSEAVRATIDRYARKAAATTERARQRVAFQAQHGHDAHRAVCPWTGGCCLAEPACHAAAAEWHFGQLLWARLAGHPYHPLSIAFKADARAGAL